MSSSSHNKLPSLRPEDGSPRGSADTRVGELRPSALKLELRPSALELEPRPVTRVNEPQHEARCEHCGEILPTLHDAFLAREEARLARDEARLIRDEARLAQARAQTEIRKQSRQVREDMHRICAEIYQLQHSKMNELTASQDASCNPSSITSFPPPPSPKTPNAMEVSNLVNVQEDEEESQ
ncbi:hypothetical protein GGI35DRAFT_291930 [Trichoderma velutinum]